MCFSALVKQNLKQLEIQFKARIDYAAFEDLFERRLNGEDITVSKSLDVYFTQHSKSAEVKRIQKLIFDWRKLADEADRAEIEKQTARLNSAIEKLKIKETKTALNDKRIASDKIEKRKKKIEWRNSDELGESDSRIWPFWYAPMIYSRDGENLIAPFRYHMRPANKDEDFDTERDGCYNARVDSLATVQWWKSVFMKKHAIMVVTRFFENVEEHRFKKSKLRAVEKSKNIIVSFDPGKGREMIVPMIFDNWRQKGKPPIDGAAAITFEPTPEVAEAGHDRTIGRLKAENVEKYLHPESTSKDELWKIIHEHEEFHFKAALAA